MGRKVAGWCTFSKTKDKFSVKNVLWQQNDFFDSRDSVKELIFVVIIMLIQCDQIGLLLKSFWYRFSYKSSPNFLWQFGKTIASKLATFCQYCEKLGYFSVQHLVTLIMISSACKMKMILRWSSATYPMVHVTLASFNVEFELTVSA